MNDIFGSDSFQSGSLLDDFGTPDRIFNQQDALLTDNESSDMYDSHGDSYDYDRRLNDGNRDEDYGFGDTNDNDPSFRGGYSTDEIDGEHGYKGYEQASEHYDHKSNYDGQDEGYRFEDSNYSQPSRYGYGADEIGYQDQGYGQSSYGDYDHSPSYDHQDERNSFGPSYDSTEEGYSDSSSEPLSLRSSRYDHYHHHDHNHKHHHEHEFKKKRYGNDYGNEGDGDDSRSVDNSYIDRSGNKDDDDYSNNSCVDNDGDGVCDTYDSDNDGDDS